MHIARPTSSRLSSMALSTHRLQLPLEIRAIASQKTRSNGVFKSLTSTELNQ